MSLGSKSTSEAYRPGIDSLTAAGMTVTVAAESSDIKAWFSNYGACIDIWAPGRHIWSASHQDDAGATRKSGTSMATPYVAGAAALVLERNPTFNYEQVRASILASAITGAIGDLKPEDTNKLLFIGGGTGPSPSPTPPTPPTPQPTTAPPAPTPVPTPPTPPPTGECVHQKDCDVSPWCNDTGFEEWCRNQGGNCPAPYCVLS